jgi:hypothetical protein
VFTVRYGMGHPHRDVEVIPALVGRRQYVMHIPKGIWQTDPYGNKQRRLSVTVHSATSNALSFSIYNTKFHVRILQRCGHFSTHAEGPKNFSSARAFFFLHKSLCCHSMYEKLPYFLPEMNL